MGELFDDYGRCIPANITASVQQKVRRYFKCDQPKLNLDAIYERISKTLGGRDELSCDEFKSRINAILDDLKNDTSCKNILNGVYVPFFIPKHRVNDMGTDLKEVYIPALETSFKSFFPDYDFKNHNIIELENYLSVAENTRHDVLLQKLEQGPVVGIYFPAMDGYSIGAAREQMKSLPDAFSLGGGIDTCAAMIGSPNLLLRLDGYPPLLWFGALEAKEAAENFHIEAYGYDLTFNRRAHLGNADEYWANGLVVTG